MKTTLTELILVETKTTIVFIMLMKIAVRHWCGVQRIMAQVPKPILKVQPRSKCILISWNLNEIKNDRFNNAVVINW